MTALERDRRKKAKGSFLGVKSPYRKVRAAVSGAGSSLAGLGTGLDGRRWGRKLVAKTAAGGGGGRRLRALKLRRSTAGASRAKTYQEQSKQKPRLDMIASRCVRLDLLKMLRESPGGAVSAYAMATILGNDQVVRYYSTSILVDDDDDADFDKFERDNGGDVIDREKNPLEQISSRLDGMNLYGGHGARWYGSSSSKHRQMIRKYRLANAVHELQKQVGANDNAVRSWDEAKKVFERVVVFADDGEDDDRNVSALTACLATSKLDETSSTYQKYKKAFEKAQLDDLPIGLTPSQRLFQQVAHAKVLSDVDRKDEGRSGALKLDEVSNRRLEEAYAERDERLKSAALREAEEALLQRERDEEARQRASQLLRPLSEEESRIVQNAIYDNGPEDEVVAKDGTDSCQRGSMHRLRPGEWLNDEVIHYFMVMLSKRDAALSGMDPARKRCHFFKSFFMTKLLNEGHADPAMDGQYEYRNVKRWSKKVQGEYTDML